MLVFVLFTIKITVKMKCAFHMYFYLLKIGAIYRHISHNDSI